MVKYLGKKLRSFMRFRVSPVEWAVAVSGIYCFSESWTDAVLLSCIWLLLFAGAECQGMLETIQGLEETVAKRLPASNPLKAEEPTNKEEASRTVYITWHNAEGSFDEVLSNFACKTPEEALADSVYGERVYRITLTATEVK